MEALATRPVVFGADWQRGGAQSIPTSSEFLLGEATPSATSDPPHYLAEAFAEIRRGRFVSCSIP